MSIWIVLLLGLAAWCGAAVVTSLVVGTAFRHAAVPARHPVVRVPAARRELSSL